MRGFLRALLLKLKGDHPQARNVAIKTYISTVRRYYGLRKHNGVAVAGEQWDCLIILDACRLDYFTNQYPPYLSGKLEQMVTRGTSTTEWLKANFMGKHDDIVYVSANPHCSDYEVHGFKGTDHFAVVENVWKYAWSDELDTVPPAQVTNAAIRCRASHPGKRMIVHYVQPHGPWIGKTRLSAAEIPMDHPIRKTGQQKWNANRIVWDLVRRGELDLDLLRQADKDNLEVVLPEAKRLVAALDGTIVVTADHGEAFGEKGIYGHPPGVYIKELAVVPWLIIQKEKGTGSAGSWSDAGKSASATIDEEVLNERLRALGYID